MPQREGGVSAGLKPPKLPSPQFLKAAQALPWVNPCVGTPRIWERRRLG